MLSSGFPQSLLAKINALPELQYNRSPPDAVGLFFGQPEDVIDGRREQRREPEKDNGRRRCRRRGSEYRLQ